MSKLKQGITLVINTKNEEKNIIECINSAKKFVDEILVADMQSTDSTVKLAQSAGAKIIKVKDYGYVEPARNSAVSKASMQWILILDADERLTPSLGKKLKRIVENNEYDVVKIPRKNIIFKKWMQRTFYWPDYSIRFYKKGFVKWSNIIHQQPEIKGEILEMEAKESNAIIHHNYTSIEQWLKKANKYTEFSQFFKDDHKVTPDELNRYMQGEFNFRFKTHEGYKDGTHGFIISKLMEYYRFLEFLKYWELKNYPDLFSLDELNQFHITATSKFHKVKVFFKSKISKLV